MNRHFVFAIALTILLMVTGIVMIPLTEGMGSSDRNILYGLVRVPVVVAGVWGFYGLHINPKKVIAFASLLSLVLMGTGVMTIANTADYSPVIQNIIYTVGRVPFIYVLAIFVFRGCSSRPALGDKSWKSK